MPNHGYCKNCYWYKESNAERWESISGQLKLIKWSGNGICFMQSKNIGIPGAELYIPVNENNYCPDYWNRKKMKKSDETLDQWINSQYEKK